MNNTIDMMAQLLEKNNIPLPEGPRKKEGGSSSYNKERCHALVDGFSKYSSLIIDSGASRHMEYREYLFSAMYSNSGPYICMGDD